MSQNAECRRAPTSQILEQYSLFSTGRGGINEGYDKIELCEGFCLQERGSQKRALSKSWHCQNYPVFGFGRNIEICFIKIYVIVHWSTVATVAGFHLVRPSCPRPTIVHTGAGVTLVGGALLLLLKPLPPHTQTYLVLLKMLIEYHNINPLVAMRSRKVNRKLINSFKIIAQS